MIGFELTPEQVQLQALARRFARETVLPDATAWDREARYPSEAVAEAAALGLLNLGIPAAYGGPGLGMLDEALIAEELGYGCMGFYTILMASDLGITPVVLAGTAEQCERFLRPLTRGARLAAFALSEPDSGSDAAALRTRARIDGDEVVLDGTKMWISNGAEAEWVVVFATAQQGAGHRGLVAVVVERGAPGMRAMPIHGKLGQRCAPTAELVLEGVRVPRANLLGEIGEGFGLAMRTLDRTRVPVAAGSVGVARRALDEARQYAGERHAFGEPIARLQAIQFKLADMAIGVETARLATWRAAWLIDQGRVSAAATAIAKCYASDTAFRAADEAVNVHGGYGYVDEYPVAKLMRDVKLNQIYEGTNEVMRLVIARSLVR
jgi:acyl-CoA dehydrogenase